MRKISSTVYDAFETCNRTKLKMLYSETSFFSDIFGLVKFFFWFSQMFGREKSQNCITRTALVCVSNGLKLLGKSINSWEDEILFSKVSYPRLFSSLLNVYVTFCQSGVNKNWFHFFWCYVLLVIIIPFWETAIMNEIPDRFNWRNSNSLPEFLNIRNLLMLWRFTNYL